MTASASKIRYLQKAVQSFFSTWALMKASRMEAGNIFTLILFLFCFLFYCRHEKLPNCHESSSYHRRAWVSGILATVFSLLYVLVDYSFYVQSLTSTLFRISILSAVLIGFFFLFYHLLMFLFFYTGSISFTNRLLTHTASAETANPFCRLGALGRFLTGLLLFYQKHMGLSCFLLCMLCWFPYFLYQFPGIMTPDSINQFEQVLGLVAYSNHHPFAHTLLFGLLYSIGYQLTGSMVIGISFYTFFQMTILALTIWYFINTLQKYAVRPLVCFVITLFYALVPYHAVYAVTIWKDILFAGAALLFGCCLFRFLRAYKWWDLCIFFISGLMLCLFRSNGWYALLLCFPFLFLYFRKKRRLMYPIILGFYLVAALFRYPVLNALHVASPDFIESLAVPTQQISAVLCNDRELTKEQQTLIENVIDLTYIKDLYNPYYADNMKELVRAGNQDYLVTHKMDFLRLWLQLGFAYPTDYLKAYVNQTYGYWYPDSFYPVAEGEGISASSLGVSHTPLLRGPLVIKTKEIAIKLGGILPLYGTLWSMGVACWVLLFCLGNSIIRREKKKLVLYLPSLALLLTVLIATPVATEFRYVYFLIFSFPFFLMAALLPEESPSFKVPLKETPAISDIADC